jgi:hypothetical protein
VKSTLRSASGSSFTREVVLERETAGTSITLRAVGRLDVEHFLAVGDRGTALVRDRERGWQAERTGTDADLVAFDGITDRSPRIDDHFHTVAVGSQGTAVSRSLDGHWQPEDTGTSVDLRAVASTGSSLVAVGAKGTMLERLPSGKWRSIASGTHASLVSVRRCGVGEVCVRAADGSGLRCTTEDGRLRCLPRDDDRAADADPSARVRLRARSQRVNHETLTQLAVAHNGDVVLTSHPTYEPASVVLPAPFPSTISAAELDAADGFLVGEDGLIVHVASSPWLVKPTTCQL